MMGFDHGATDSGQEPLADFSTCSHPFGPCPHVLDAVLRADLTRYPDPSYQDLRERLGAFHGAEPDRVVPGGGASELILRMTRCVSGDVLAWSPSFVEYRRAAHVCGRRFLQASKPDVWLDLVPPGGIAFLCQPNNPDGLVHRLDFLEAAAAQCRIKNCRLVLDLAYADFCPNLPALPPDCDLLIAPNKKFGLTGIRAGVAVCADSGFARLVGELAPSWVIGPEGVAFLGATVEPAAARWFTESLPGVRRATHNLRSLLEEMGWELLPSQAHFFTARPGIGEAQSPAADLSARWTRDLRAQGIRVRDLTNTGLPGWLRLAARQGKELELLRSVLQERIAP